MTCPVCGCEVLHGGPHEIVRPRMRNKIPGQPEGHAEWITDHHEDGRPRYETIRETCPGAAAQPEEKSRG